MRRQDYITLFILSLVILWISASLQSTPGYMDADYYLMGGENLAEGKGFQEWVLWNYLDDPAGIPHPSHGYWMPLASIIAALGLMLLPAGGYASAQLGFILIAAALAPLAAMLADRIAADRPPRERRALGITAGIFAIFSGFYLSFMTATDTFGVYAVLGGSIVVLVAGDRRVNLRYLILGVLTGLMHLARADGVVWFFLVLGWVWWERRNQRESLPLGKGLALVFGGYLVPMAPWFLLNLTRFGSPLAPGGVRALWFTQYDDLFRFPAATLTFSSWLQTGLGSILEDRLWALGQNLQSLIAVQGMIFLFPFILWGIWSYRSKLQIRFAVLAWLVTILIMTIVFPFPGARGGFFHSGAAIQPLFWAAAPIGLDAFIRWGARKRGWRIRQANSVFRVGFILLAAGLSIWLVLSRMEFNLDPSDQGSGYAAVEEFLRDQGALPDSAVMVNNPPGYYLASERPAFVIPSGGLSPIQQVGTLYKIRYLVLEETQGLDDLYNNPGDRSDLHYLGSVAGVRVFELP